MRKDAAPNGLATDICGYDERMRDFAFKTPTSIACIMLEFIWAIFVDDGPMGILHDGDAVSVAVLSSSFPQA